MVGYGVGTHLPYDIYRVMSPPESKEPNPISVQCSDAEIWLIYMIVWLLGYCKWLLGCGYRVIG